jgi:DNA adenine methylase
MTTHFTPLRYPGGKQKIAAFVVELLRENDLIDGHYVEPYAGGAGVAIDLLINNVVSCVHLNDASRSIYAFWKSVLVHTEELCRKISRASLTISQWKQQREILRNPSDYSMIDLGFSTLYLNRCNRSGVLTGGVIGGLDQTGAWKMDARFSRNELIRRIETIAAQKNRIRLRNWDAEKFLCSYVSKLPQETFVYCDPPYFEKSSRLYLNVYNPDDHRRLSQTIQKNIHHKWMVSYDDSPIIRQHYSGRRRFVYGLQYSASTVYRGREVLFFSDKTKIPKASSLPFINSALQVYTSKLV